MLKWWNKQIKFQNNAQMEEKGKKRNKWEKKREKRIKCEKMLKWWKKGKFGL